MLSIQTLQNLVRDIVDGCYPAFAQDYGSYYSPYYALMQVLGKLLSPCVCVELGVEKGRGSYSLLVGGNLVIGIDCQPTDDALKLTHDNPTFVYLVQPSMVVPDNILKHKTISILHIDTEHSYKNAEQEFNAYLPYLAKGSVALFDDTHAMDGGVLKFVESLPYEKIIDDRLHPICGYGVVLI